jgi:hypothetical protein
MTISNSNPPSLITNHPPLAHDAQGCKVAVPAGARYWRILRFTAGRPKTLPGRFDLDLTPEQLVEMCGPGQYRIEALDEYGKPLGEVAKLIVGVPPDVPTAEHASNQNARTFPATSDTRFMLETLAQMSRFHSESLQSLANAQADWIKTLATAKQLPRNAAPPQFQFPAPPSVEPDEPEPWWVHMLKPQTLLAVNGLLRNVGSWFGMKPEPAEPEKRRNASALAQIAERASAEKAAASPADFGRALEVAFAKATGLIDAGDDDSSSGKPS